MRLQLTLRPLGCDEFTVPLRYNEFVQAAVYRMLPEDFSTFLHDTGYTLLKRSFRFFTFSRLLGKYEILRNEGRIRFHGPVRLVILSPLQEIVEAIHQQLVRDGTLRIGSEVLELTDVMSTPNTVTESRLTVRTLSPVTAYSTMLRPDGRKYTVYFHPRESAFAEAIQENMRKKSRIARDLLGMPIDIPEQSFPFEVSPVGRMQKSVVTYKGISVQGFSGRFELSGSPSLLSLALELGIGSKNSQGFGCIERVTATADVEGREKRAY
ncbi:CRISPR-associated endoribonuclease Cas6 [Alicyclobacillus herbarius]|uniref:CRISPR-associated endoribonuclease Cas6 n=1 Tax=Alicyclobacillus herbarius TaxID=122960 RepID=UPI000420D48E|nr:CRISPR-associated endoribonuclease Cas6 [Alicyclobacillus herbarius]